MFKKVIATLASLGIVAMGNIALNAAQANAAPLPQEKLCIATPEWTEYIQHPAEKVKETRWKKEVQTKKTQYRSQTRVWIEKYKEEKSVKGYDFIDGGTTRVSSQTVSGHWVESEGWHKIPDVIINIVWGPNGPPDSVLGTGRVNLSVYGGPSVTVDYKAEKVNYSGWSDWGPWSDWQDSEIKKSDTTNVETRQVDSDKPYTIYYNPNGDPTRDLTDKNWVPEGSEPGGSWVFVDKRDRVIKEAWTEEIFHPATYKPCESEGKNVTRKFQVDTYRNPTSKLAKKAAAYDNDNKLKWAEDKPHYGKSYWQIVKIKGKSNWTRTQWIDAINRATTKKGVGSVNSTSHIKTVKKGQRLTVAWEIKKDSWPDSKKRKPQVFFARGVK